MKKFCTYHFFHKMKQAKGLWFHLAGMICLFWFLFRVLPAPHRSQYPCQQLAIPIAFGYIAFWSILLHGAIVTIKHMQRKTTALAPALLIGFILIASITGFGFAGSFNQSSIPYAEWTPVPKDPMGIPQGVVPGRVVWVWNPDATEQTLDGYWWETQNNNQSVINEMFSDGLQAVTHAASDADAWDVLFTSFNENRGLGNKGYELGEKIAIKVNLNNCYNAYSFIDSYTYVDNERDAHPAVIKALLKQLTTVAGVPEEDIVVYDSSRPMPNWFYDPLVEAYPDVTYVDGFGGASGRNKAQPSDVSFYFSDGVVRTLPECVVDATYLINVPLLKQHPINHGVTLSGKNMFGTFIEDVRDLHPYHESGQIMGNAAPQVDLFASEDIGKKTMLFLGDGLYATLNDHRTIFHFNMYPFNDDWTNSLFFSQDPVAIDSVMYDFLHTEGPNPIEGSQNYLHEAAVIKQNLYDPENDGVFLSESLGVHEHWDPTVSIFSKDRYSGPEEQGIDFLALGQNHANNDIVITQPVEDGLYVFGSEQSIAISWKMFYRFPTTLVFGPILVKASAQGDDFSVEEVQFLVDDIVMAVDTTAPYEWEWSMNSFGEHILSVSAWNNGEEVSNTQRSVLKFF